MMTRNTNISQGSNVDKLDMVETMTMTGSDSGDRGDIDIALAAPLKDIYVSNENHFVLLTLTDTMLGCRAKSPSMST
jgi:hypothetical protein